MAKTTDAAQASKFELTETEFSSMTAEQKVEHDKSDAFRESFVHAVLSEEEDFNPQLHAIVDELDRLYALEAAHKGEPWFDKAYAQAQAMFTAYSNYASELKKIHQLATAHTKFWCDGLE